MPYSELGTAYIVYKKLLEKKKKEPDVDHKKLAGFTLDAMDFYTKYIPRFAKTDPTMACRCIAEQAWYRTGCPYYNIHSNFIAKLCKCNLSKIPASLFRMPHGLESVHVRFKDLHPEFKYTEAREEKTLWASSVLVYEIPAYSDTRRTISMTIDMLENQSDIGKVFNLEQFKIEEKLGARSLCVFNITLENKETLQDSIDIAINRKRPAKDMLLIENSSYKDLVKNVLSLCSTIGFLSDNPTICEPDILTADKHLIEKSNAQELEVLHQKARDKRKYGWNIGTDRMFLGPQPFQLANKSQALEGRELEYAHIRAGHPHAVRYGKGKELVKIMWFVPLTVRPDLPFKIEQQTQTTL